ncbi:hypothetical protein GCM10010532_074190 [Dactylosporangium siamense]|uniref:DUF3558 domain-containing protein n=1 Tax=Dactylosporangium siamense TaxID=685454 RepID=A0A919PQC7_9ACTN|nr:hypothetical protein Dsi01nite_054470 [Dactylosporangium siamense]
MLSAGVVLALAGCGDDTSGPAQPSDPKRNGGLYDAVDVCGLATDDQLKAALGEAPGTKERRDTDSLKACSVDGVSGNFYLFLVLVRPSMGAAQQVAYDKGTAKDPKSIDATTYSSADTGEAHVETASGELVVRVSFVYYQDGGSITDAPAVVGRLHTLLGAITKKT